MRFHNPLGHMASLERCTCHFAVLTMPETSRRHPKKKSVHERHLHTFRDHARTFLLVPTVEDQIHINFERIIESHSILKPDSVLCTLEGVCVLFVQTSPEACTRRESS